MKERPILMSCESVRAIIDGRKTQTRRIINPQPTCPSLEAKEWFDVTNGSMIRCPHGEPGDGLWVREAWKIQSFMDGEPLLFRYWADGGEMKERDCDAWNYEEWWERVCVQSSDELYAMKWTHVDEEGIFTWEGESPLRWRPSIFMPRWASRIDLQLLSVRAERLQDISQEDAMAEGMLFLGGMADNWDDAPWADPGDLDQHAWRWPRGAFRACWDRINGKRAPWKSNPLVWREEFALVEVRGRQPRKQAG